MEELGDSTVKDEMAQDICMTGSCLLFHEGCQWVLLHRVKRGLGLGREGEVGGRKTRAYEDLGLYAENREGRNEYKIKEFVISVNQRVRRENVRNWWSVKEF